jgi:hypothetical protein
MRKYIGPAFAGTLKAITMEMAVQANLGIRGVEGFSTSAPSSALSLGDRGNATGTAKMVKDTLNLPQIATHPTEVPPIDPVACAHFEKLGENPDKLVRALERYTRRKDLSSSKKISEKPKEDVDNKRV